MFSLKCAFSFFSKFMCRRLLVCMSFKGKFTQNNSLHYSIACIHVHVARIDILHLRSPTFDRDIGIECSSTLHWTEKEKKTTTNCIRLRFIFNETVVHYCLVISTISNE